MAESILQAHSAAPSAAGYLFQFRRALIALIEGRQGHQIGIETLDDVSIVSRDGHLTLEQDKFTTTGSGEVYSNQSHNLLNTLCTWVDALLNKEIDPSKTSFILVTNSKCTTSLVHEIHDAKSEAEVNEVLSKILSLEGSGQDLIRLKELLNSQSGLDVFRCICPNIELVDGDSDTWDPSAIIPVESRYEGNRQTICNALLGWMHNCALSAWVEKKAFVISHQSYINQLGAICEEIKCETIREKPFDKISVSLEEIIRAHTNTFVRQVELVTDDPTYSDDAIEDYLKCITEKMRLSSLGEITDDAWISFDRELYGRWHDIFRQTQRTNNGLPSDEIGFRIMSKTLDCEYLPPLAGQRINYPYLSRGSYHRLSDVLQIGWHPNYKKLFEENENGCTV